MRQIIEGTGTKGDTSTSSIKMYKEIKRVIRSTKMEEHSMDKKALDKAYQEAFEAIVDKHTLGPWYYHNMVNAMNDKTCKDEFWVTDNPIDDGSGAIIASGLTEEHACLIAIAPELLEALKIAMDAATKRAIAEAILGRAYDDTELVLQSVWRTKLPDWYFDAEQAIAKVEERK